MHPNVIPMPPRSLADAFADAATGLSEPKVGGDRRGEPSGNTIRISNVFAFQSYFDDALRQNAILLQPPNTPIVAVRDEQTAGYAVGLHPSSQTPIAIMFKAGSGGTSAPLILRPGQIERPHGKMFESNSGHFTGFQWGLPFGWLGGGLATIHVFQTPDADVAWPGDAEVIFHRQRLVIADVANVPANAPLNWPLRFPWPNAGFLVAGLATVTPQGGQPVISIAQPTRTYMRLRMATLVNPPAPRMRIVWQGTDDFDLNAAGAVVGTSVTFMDYTWPTTAPLGAPAGNLTTLQYPILELESGFLVRSQAENGGVVLIDGSGANILRDNYVDVVRYGRL